MNSSEIFLLNPWFLSKKMSENWPKYKKVRKFPCGKFTEMTENSAFFKFWKDQSPKFRFYRTSHFSSRVSDIFVHFQNLKIIFWHFYPWLSCRTNFGPFRNEQSGHQVALKISMNRIMNSFEIFLLNRWLVDLTFQRKE